MDHKYFFDGFYWVSIFLSIDVRESNKFWLSSVFFVFCMIFKNEYVVHEFKCLWKDSDYIIILWIANW